MITLTGRSAIAYALAHGIQDQLIYTPIPQDRTRRVRRSEWRAFKRRRTIERLHFIRENGGEKAVTPGAFGLAVLILKLLRRKK